MAMNFFDLYKLRLPCRLAHVRAVIQIHYFLRQSMREGIGYVHVIIASLRCGCRELAGTVLTAICIFGALMLYESITHWAHAM